jgi:citrate lyase subunit beta/citryl-CoA lyase
VTVRPLSHVRSVLFAPAVRPDFLAKLPARGADAVVIDCEDATPPTAKNEARATVRRLGPELVAAGCQVMVRVNAVATEWFAADIGGALTRDLAAVVVPKVETTGELDSVRTALDGVGLVDLGVVAGLETARGVADARLVLEHPAVIGAYFGAEDFIADMGGRRTKSNAEVLHARSEVVLAARLAGVPALDQVVTDFGDGGAFAVEAAEARNLGYHGKLCIHPAQVPLANRAFTPDAAEVDRARRLLYAFDRAAAHGVAALAFEGQMVDEPLASQARRVIALAAAFDPVSASTTGEPHGG